MRLDHLAVAAQTLEEGVQWVQDRLGVQMGPGGEHARFGTHNMLLGLADGLYLEVIACDPSGHSEGPRWFGLDHFQGPPRLTNWICEPDDFEAALAQGMQAVPMQRGDLRWDMGVPQDGSLPMGGAYPTVLRWHTDTPPGRSLPTSGCALHQLTVAHPWAEQDLSQLIDDPRVVYQSGPIRLSAEIDCPKGRVTL